MKILETIPCIKKPERPLDGVIYLENDDTHQTLASKIDMLKGYDFDYAVFHHQDLIIRTPELIPAQCERMRMDNVGVAGLIGTLCLFDSCQWWQPQRNIVTVGAIIQGDGKGGEYPMLDGPGYRPDVVSVDGCLMIFDRAFIQKYEPHDFGSWRYLYDVDACLQCLQMGKNVAIVDIRCKHDSQGKMTADFEQARQKFLAYWKPRVEFPVIRQSVFRVCPEQEAEVTKSKKIYCPAATSCRRRDTCGFKVFGTLTDKIDSNTETNELKIPPCEYTGSEK